MPAPRSSTMSPAASMPIGEAHQLLAQSGGLELRRIHLLVRGAGGMDDQRLGVADIGEMAGQPQRLDELAPGGAAALDAAADDGAGPARQQSLGELEIRMAMASEGWRTHSTALCLLRNSSTAAVFSMWRCMRSARVSTPCSRWKALVGDRQAPKSRKPSVRARMMKADGPNSSANTMP